MSVALTAVLVGSTGLIGKYLLPDLISSPKFSRVGELGRRVTTPTPSDPTSKLTQQSINFDELDEPALKEPKWDVVYISLGTTKAIAGSAEAFTKIDRTYVTGH